MAVIALIAVGVTMPRHEVGLIEGRMDWWGAALMTVVLIALTKLVAHGSAQGRGAVTTLIYIAIFVVSAVAFTLVERRRHDPLINPAHLVSRQIWPLLATTILFTVAFSAVIYFTFVLFAQDTKVGYGLSAAVIAALASPFTGWLTGTIGGRSPCGSA